MNKKLKKFVSLSIFLVWLFQAVFSPISKGETVPDGTPPQSAPDHGIPPIVRSPGIGDTSDDRN